MPLVVFVVVWSSSLMAEVRDVVRNGSFENGLSDDGRRPEYWHVGFPGDPPIDSLGFWEFDSACAGSGNVSLHLVPQGDDGTYFVGQVLDLPTFDLTGKMVTFTLRMRTLEPDGAHAVLFTYNPECPDTTGLGPNVGFVILSPGPGDSSLVELSGSFTASGPAALMAVVLSVEPWSGGAWFDDVSVVVDVAEAGVEPDTSEVEDPLLGQPREFLVGTVSEIARNNSEAAYEDLPLDIAEIGDMVNVFAHVQWNSLRGEPPCLGHEQQISFAGNAAAVGLDRMLTLDFTHESFTAVGNINPMPDGTPVPALTPDVRAAYLDELVALVGEIEPVIVSIGIEASIFSTVRPDQWDNYVLLMEDACAALAQFSGVHITSYFCLKDMITPQGSFYPTMRSAWERILPYCDSVAYSFYPELADTALLGFTGYFALPKALAPGKPLMIPEFGCRSDAAQGFSEELQYEFMRTVVAQVAESEPPPVALTWFAMYDFQYLGAPSWAKDAFATLGVRDFTGTPKLVHAAFRKMRDNTQVVAPRHEQPIPSFLTVTPNPVTDRCTIRFTGAQALSEVEIYDLSGRLVDTLPAVPGRREAVWSTAGVPSMFYVARLAGRDARCQRGFLVIK